MREVYWGTTKKLCLPQLFTSAQLTGGFGFPSFLVIVFVFASRNWFFLQQDKVLRSRYVGFSIVDFLCFRVCWISSPFFGVLGCFLPLVDLLCLFFAVCCRCVCDCGRCWCRGLLVFCFKIAWLHVGVTWELLRHGPGAGSVVRYLFWWSCQILLHLGISVQYCTYDSTTVRYSTLTALYRDVRSQCVVR